MRAAGYRGPDLFSPSVIHAIAKASEGLTRRVNLIADKALLAAFSENTHTIKRKHIRAAVRDSDFSDYEPPQPRLKLGLALSLLAIGTGLGVALYALFQASYQADGLPAREPAAAATTGPPPAAESAAAPTAAPAATSTGDSELAATAAAALHNPPPAPAPATTATAPGATAAAPAEKALPAPAQSISRPLKSIVSADSQKGVDSADALEARLKATQTWLAQQDKSTYSIQLLGADNARQLKHHLNVISKLVEINEIFVYRTVAKQKPSLTVLYGTFNDRRAAQDALAKLPAPLKANKPILRTVQGIRAEIAQHQSS
jgi:septal ring-binding cell division protein DamX